MPVHRHALDVELSTATSGELRGIGSPVGVVSAVPGTYYTDTSGTNGAWRWLKTAGVDTAGWEVSYGDTGWRDMEVAFQDICTANALTYARKAGFTAPRVRRIGDSLFFSIGVNITGTGIDTVDFQAAFAQTTVGFRGGVHINNWQIPASVSGSVGVIHWSPGYYVRFWSAGDQVFTLTLTTTDPWPTALPGVSA